MYLFFDTETTGLPRTWNAPVEDIDNWPRMVQLAWQLYSKDEELIDSVNHIIIPEGYEIPQEAASVHGITTERAKKEGVDLKYSLDAFQNSLNNSELLVAHNIRFDEKIIGAELIRKSLDYEILDMPKLCTMKSSTDYCKLPGEYGYKWPSLTELHIKLFDEAFDEAHDAEADVSALARCFFELKKRKVIEI